MFFVNQNREKTYLKSDYRIKNNWKNISSGRIKFLMNIN